MYQLVNADQTGLINNMKSKGLERDQIVEKYHLVAEGSS